MKRNIGVVKSAKIINVISAGLMFLAGLPFLLFFELETLPAARLILSIIFGLTSLSKLFGYFSNDLYRLAFQFDLAIGVFCGILAVLIAFLPESAGSLVPCLISIYVILDSLLKVQTALDARRFGMRAWLAILLSALVLCVAGGFALSAALQNFVSRGVSVSVALMTDGLVNAFVTAYTVRIRARKKNLSDKYGFEE